MLEILLPLLILAFLVHLLRTAPAALAQPTRSLPSPYRLTPARAGWVVERHEYGLSASTTAFNALPKRLVERLGTRRRAAVTRFYDAGATLGVVGALLGVGGAVWAWGSVWLAVWAEAEAHARQAGKEGSGAAAHVLRRALERVGSAPVEAGSGGLQPLIPGVTMPLAHLPTLVLALVLAQLVHELGHAIAAALEDVSPSKLAFNLHLILPSAAVVLPSSVDFLPARARARLATSGPWHNLLLWGALIVAGVVCTPVLWADVAYEGRAVESVATGSALEAHLKPGDIVTHVDDVFIGGRGDIWTRYLTGEDVTGDLFDESHAGWCLSKFEFNDAEVAPCSAAHEIAFQVVGDASEARCLSPHSIVFVPSRPCASGCTQSQLCIRPADYERIVRLRVRSGKQRDTVLWSGERAALLNDVHVSRRSPRLFSSATRWSSLFMNYLKLVSLSLFLFNLLPLPHTDGIALFSALFPVALRGPGGRSSADRQLTGQPSRHPTINPYRYDSDDEDETEPRWTGHSRREEVWARRVRRTVEGVMAAVVAGWIAGWAMLALLRSS